MTSRKLILALAAGLVALGLGGVEARAGSLVPLPATLDNFVIPNFGNYADVGNLRFFDFTYTPTNVVPGGPPPPPAASSVQVSAFTVIPGEIGITFTAGFNVPAGAIYDYAITYKVTTLDDSLIHDGYQSITGGNFGGDGQVSAGETITDTNGNLLATWESTLGSPVKTGSWNGVKTIFVSKDILLVGGSQGSTVSIIHQGFSTTAIPEPASMALLGIGLSGILSIRRLIKRVSVA